MKPAVRFFVVTATLLLGVTCLLFAGGAAEEGSAAAQGNKSGARQEAAEQDTITVTDSKGVEVTITRPVGKIVSINSGLSEIVAALGCAERTVGRCSYSTFPSKMREVFVVAKNSSSPNLERILQLEPDLVLADRMFDESSREMLNNRDIPVLIESTSNPDTLPDLVRKLGKVLGEEDRAEEVIRIASETIEDVHEAVEKAQQQREGLPVVFFENRKVYKSASKKTGHHMFIELAGGDNIAKDEPVRSPELSPEYIVQRDPDVIVRRVSGDAGPDALEKMLKSIYNRPSLQSVQAVENENVHIIKSDLFISLRFPVGVAYYASWFYPELLGTGAEDFDPSRIHRNYVTNLYGEEEWEKTNETYVYP